jgi:hypothetical protein
MGRTIPTATMLIEHEIDLCLRSYGKGLSGKHEQKELYDILQLSKKHTQACGQAVRLVPFHSVLMSILIEQQKQLASLVDEISRFSGKHGSGLR